MTIHAASPVLSLRRRRPGARPAGPLILGLTAIGGCVTPLPPSPPKGADSAVVAVRLATDGLFGLEAEMDHVYFVRMDREGELIQDRVIPSDYFLGDYALLLNARPGLYAVVAGQRMNRIASGQPNSSLATSTGFDTVGAGFNYLPADLANRTVTKVEPGAIAFMGDFVIDPTDELESADAVQSHYIGLLDRHVSFGSCATLVREDRSPEAAQRFRERTRETLELAGWGKMLAASP